MSGRIEVSVTRPSQPSLALSGDIDLTNREVLVRRIVGLLALPPTAVTIDATDVSYIDAGSLKLLERARRRCADRGVSMVVERASHVFVLVAGLAGYDLLLPPAASSFVPPGPRPGGG